MRRAQTDDTEQWYRALFPDVLEEARRREEAARRLAVWVLLVAMGAARELQDNAE
jgi:hypothetical protein